MLILSLGNVELIQKKDGKQYKLQTKDLCKQAKLANINFKSNS